MKWEYGGDQLGAQESLLWLLEQQSLGQLTPVLPSCFHSSLYFLSPWFSVTFLLTSNRNLAPVLTSLRAIGWIGSWKIWNNWSSFHKVHGLNGNYSEGTGGNKYSYSVFLSVFLSFVVFLYLVWWGFVSLRKLFLKTAASICIILS